VPFDLQRGIFDLNQLPQIIFSPEARKHLWIVKILSPFNQNAFFTAKDRATLLSDSLVIDLRYIQIFLGHDSSKTTEVYTDVSNVNFERFKNPLDDI